MTASPPPGDPEVIRAFVAAVEAALEAGVIYGNPDPDSIALRACHGGDDAVSTDVAAVACRMWGRAGRPGLDRAWALWRAAALIVIGWLVGRWLSLAPAAARAVPPVAPAPERVAWCKVRALITDRMTAGPPALVAVSEVPVIDP